MPIVDESKQNKGVNNNTRNKQMAINMEYQNRLKHPRFKSPYFGAKYQQRVIPVRTLNGVQDIFVNNRGTIKQGGHTYSKLYNYSNKNRSHPIAYAREIDSWNNNTSPIKALVNSGIGYALAPAAQAIYDYTKGALDISKNPTKASNYLVMLPAIGYAVKVSLKRGVEVAPFNGQASGIGGNQLLNSSRGGLGGDVTAILNNRVSINSFQDYVNSIKNRLQRTDPNYYLFDDINRKVAQGTLSIEEGTKQTTEYSPLNNYVYSSNPQYDYTKAYYKYPQYGIKNFRKVVHMIGKLIFL